MLDFFPILKFKVNGNSMYPTVKNGESVLINRFSYLFTKPKAGDLVIIKIKNYIIKRITKIENKKYFVVGDNQSQSIDSRDFGWIGKKEIVGKVIYKI